MARLPQPGGDSGNWGNILNDFLSQALDSDGTIKDNAVTANTIAPNSITSTKIASNAIGAAAIADGSITESLLDSNVTAKLNAGGSAPSWADITGKPAVIASGATQVDARNAIGAGTSNLVIGTTNTTAKAGDYQPSASNITDATAIGRALLTAADATTAKTALTLAKADVGLGDVDNTSDASKPVSTAQQTALDTKVDKVSMANRVLATDGNSGQTHYSWTVGASADSFVRRTSDGNIRTSTPTDSADAANKGYVDTAVAGLVAPASSQSLSNKTLVNPQLSGSVLDTNGNPLIMSNSWSANATNYLGVESSGLGDQYVQLNALGDDANINLSLRPKGTGAVSIFTGSNDTAVLGANGTATNVNLNLLTKGSGTVMINGAEAVTTSGAQTLSNKTLDAPRINSIRDTAGNPSLDLGAIPNAVNRIYIDNQSTGNYPTIGATGPDSNIGIALSPKNDGPINVFGNAPTLAAAGGANGGNLDLNLKSQGTGTVKANGRPVMSSWMANPFYTSPDRFEPWPQMMNGGGNWSIVSGDMPMTFFTPAIDMTVNNIITMGWNDTTQADATSCRVAIFRVDDLFAWPADMTCIARSAHKPDRWNGPSVDIAPIADDGAASPSAISSVQLSAGQQYAVGFLSVGHTGSPKLSALGGYRKNTLEPHIGFFASGGYTDMPTHLTGGWLEEWTFVWFALT